MNKKIVLVSGASGSGKSTLRLKLREYLGEIYDYKVAGIDIDDVYTFLDPNFSVLYNEEIWSLARKNAGCVTNCMLKKHINTVFIFSNVIFNYEQVEEVVGQIQLDTPPVVYHITLAPSRDTLANRLIMRQNHVPDWLDQHLTVRTPYYVENWAYKLDNSSMSPEATLDAIQNFIKNNKKTSLSFTKTESEN